MLESSADLFGGDEIIVRTALNPDGTALKIDRKTVRKALGPIGGGAVKLTDNAEVTTCLGAGEGTETVLLGYALRGDLMRAAFADFRGDKVLIGRSPLGQSVERARWDSAGRGPTVSFSRSCWA